MGTCIRCFRQPNFNQQRRPRISCGRTDWSKFYKRNDIIDANTEFTGYCRLYSGTNAPDRKQGILISIFTGSCTAQFYFFSWPKAFYVRLKWDTWGKWTYVASIKG